MIKSISFENYKSFKDATTLDIKPITILVGPNSSGKSSIIKLFGLISQSYNEGNPNSQLLYKGKDCDLGDFKTMSHNNLKEPIHIGFKMDAYSQDDNLKSYMKEAGEYELSIDIENNSEITKHSYKEENDDNSQISELFSIYKDDRGNHLLKTKEPLGDIISHFDKELKVLKKILKIGFGKSYTNNDIRGIGEQIYDRVNRANVKIRGLKVLEIDPFELPDAQPREFVWKVLNQPDPTVGMPRGVLYFLQQFKNHDSCFITTALGVEKNSLADLIKHELVVDLHNNSYGFIGDLQFTMKDGGRMHYSIETPFDALYEIISDKDNEKYRYALAYGAVQLIYNDIDNLIKERWKNINDNWLMRHTYATQAVNLSDIVIHRPVRPDPKRIYLKEDLLELGINEVEDIDNIVTDVNYSMEILGIPYQLKVDKIKVVGNVPELYTIAINDLISNTIHNYSDVGYGLSQIIPILFSMKNKKKWDSVESLIIIEQPELHLHPRTQARLVEVFYNNIVSRGDKYAKRNFIIETHSEHLVRGLQVLVAKKNLLPEDIAIYYVDKNTHGDSFVKRMHIDDAGYFKESWPEGFFDQAYRQSVELITSKH